jgi:hypothetical protein
MDSCKPETQFREDEIAYIKRFDKQRQEWVVNPHPKVGGRLRLAHEGNEALSIETDIGDLGTSCFYVLNSKIDGAVD